MVALPVILGVMAFCFAAGLLYWLYLKFTGKLTGAASMEETIRESMNARKPSREAVTSMRSA